ncbi:type VI secretion system-associated FHA domain protein TagH [Colwellia sp. MSW7]|uniref:Type VI secretion system-associated FHA domain protein TagH n=1 Tax=Colwellia maritima TaxID=2912588 RepID=A0ABS9X295_9GAMM|nr:type VI secretion system-associated FHA domain protein TagH [Colwellia maritima]MCI2284344.1 type VI secretion system-associated FHA domain protein TagH [Colwellia maritima]
MELIFEIVSYHRLSPEQTSKMCISDTLTFGRSENNDWHLPDPEKIVSGFHARVEKRVDGFYIYDLSTNGLYINRAVEALGTTNTHKLSEGDLLTFGDYEVSVSIINKTVPNEAMPSAPPIAQTIAQPAFAQHSKPVVSSPVQSPVQGIAPSTLFGDQPLASNNASNILVTNDLNDHFDVPQPIPEEWDTNILKTKVTNNPVFDEPLKPTIAPVAPVHSETAIPVQPVENKQQEYTAPIAATNTNFDAFIKGLGISESIKSEQLNDELLFEMGQSMQLMLMGLVESLRTRSALKSEFRINQTTFQQQENNPLKFSATIDDVFHNLFLKRSSSFLPSSKAITEAFNDTKKHDIALTAGTIGAIEGIFNQLAPTEIEKKTSRTLSLIS